VASVHSQELVPRIKDVGKDFPNVFCVAIDLVPMIEFVLRLTSKHIGTDLFNISSADMPNNIRLFFGF